MENITINKDIEKKASNILVERELKIRLQKKTERYIEKCIEAEICPICGESLLKREATKEEKRKSNYDYMTYVLYCEKSDFIHIEGGYYDDYDD